MAGSARLSLTPGDEITIVRGKKFHYNFDIL